MEQDNQKQNLPVTKLRSLFSYSLSDPFGKDIHTDPNSFIPDTFPSAKSSTISNVPLDGDRSGQYNEDHNQIEINSSGGPTVSGVTAHETGHAIWMKDLNPLHAWNSGIDNDSNTDEFLRRANLRTQWADLHDKYLKNNLSLGNYLYKDDPSHSFADAWSVYVTNPDRLKNHFPEMYDYMKKISLFEYKRNKEAPSIPPNSDPLRNFMYGKPVKTDPTDSEYLPPPPKRGK